MILFLYLFLAVAGNNSVLAAESPSATTPALTIERHLTLAPGSGNPRNSEGDFIRLNDGRWLFIYTHFTSGARDDAKAYLASRESLDNGRTWSAQDKIVVANEGGANVMSVSLLRLPSGEIAMFYLRKNSLQDCRPIVRFSRDEAKTWSEPTECITNEVAYYVMNNNRVIQLKDGRLLMPFSRHAFSQGQLGDGEVLTYWSDDQARTWHRSRSTLKTDDHGARISFMEPGVVAVDDQRILMVIRTRLGCQYFSESKDRGETWSTPKPSEIFSPEAPATLAKIPTTGDLLLIWDDHAGQPLEYRRKQPPIRHPLAIAISRDGGRSWEKKKVIESGAGHGYCYTAVAFEGRRVLLAYCAHKSPWGLETTQISSFQLDDLYR